jgi:hypothetical protein
LRFSFSPLLQLLSSRFDAHVLLNGLAEKRSMRSITKHFANLVKVDNHIHTSSSATASHLLDYVRRCYHSKKDTVVLSGGRTIGSVVDGVTKDIDSMTLDSLGMNEGDTFGRFDRWKTLYLPFSDNDMRQGRMLFVFCV